MDYSYSYSGGPSDAAAGGFLAMMMAMMGIIWLILLVVAVVTIAGLWKVFVKAGKPGWAAIVPIYNVYIILEIVGRPTWWLAFLLVGFIPFIGNLALLVFLFIIFLDLARSFGKNVGFAIGLTIPFVNAVFFPILGFGSAQYLGPKASGFGLPDTPVGYAGAGNQPPAPGYAPPAPPGGPAPSAPPGGPAPAPPAPPSGPAPSAPPSGPAPSAPPAGPAPAAPGGAPPAPPAPPAAPSAPSAPPSAPQTPPTTPPTPPAPPA